MSEWLGYHFLPLDRRLRWGTRDVVRVGTTSAVEGGGELDLCLCRHGLHASKRALDALRYAPGAVACRVSLSGERLNDIDKSCAAERTVLAMADATNLLHEFACCCAEVALLIAGYDDKRCWDAIEAKCAWMRGEMTRKQVYAVRTDIWSTAEAFAAAEAVEAADARGYAATAAIGSVVSATATASAPRSASWAAADAAEAAGYASWAAVEAARYAAENMQNELLESMLSDAFGVKGNHDRHD